MALIIVAKIQPSEHTTLVQVYDGETNKQQQKKSSTF